MHIQEILDALRANLGVEIETGLGTKLWLVAVQPDRVYVGDRWRGDGGVHDYPTVTNWLTNIAVLSVRTEEIR